MCLIDAIIINTNLEDLPMKSKRTGKPVFFVVFILILALTYTAFFGIENYYGDTRKVYLKGAEDIRWGIDIRGGVEAVFSPDKAEKTAKSDCCVRLGHGAENRSDIVEIYLDAKK